MNQPVSVTAPITSLLGELQDISSVLASVKAAEMPVVETDESLGWPAEAWSHIKRVTALSQGDICAISQIDLDRLIINYVRNGILITQYEASIGAIVYRRPDFSVIGMSVGDRHFCHRDVRPMQSPTLYIQAIGRFKRPMQPADYALTSAAPGHAAAFVPLTKEGGAGEGASDATSRMAMAIALFTDGINTPDAAQ